MPLDASIPYEAIRGLQKAEPYDPIAVQTDIDRQRVYQAAAQKAQQQMAEQADLQQLAQQYGNDYDGLIDAAAKHGHTEWALDIGKKLQDGRAAGAQQRWEQTRASRAEIQSDLAEMQGQDATTWPDYSQTLAKKYPQLAPAILRPFSPQLIQQLAGIGQSQDQWLQSIETGAKSVADGKTLKGFAEAYAGADTPEKRAVVDQMADSAKAAGMKTYFPDAASAQAYLDKQAKEKPEKSATVGSFEDYMTADPQHRAQILKDRKAYNQADDRALKPTFNVNMSAPGDPKTWETTGADVLKTIPAQWRNTVKKIGDYDEDPTKVLAARGGERSMVMRWVNQYNPNYKQDEFAVRSPTRKAFTTGTQGQQINAMNTAIGHIDQLGVLVEGLNNGDFTPGNKAWNSLRTMFGSDKVTNFDTLKDALSGEVASILSKSGATVSGIAEAKEKISAANSPAQLAGYIKTQIPIMGSKLAALDYQFKQAMGDDHFSALSPDSKRVLEKYGFDPAHPTLDSKATGPKKDDVRPMKGHPDVLLKYDGTQWIRIK